MSMYEMPFKGWMQTWLVHNRNPWRLLMELGLGPFLVFQFMSLGMIVSALIHPVYLATIIAILSNPRSLWEGHTVLTGGLLGFEIVNLVAGYLAMGLLGGRAFAWRGRRASPAILAAVPIYWLMMTFACYRALFQLLGSPFHWEKTPHRGRAEALAKLPQRFARASQRRA